MKLRTLITGLAVLVLTVSCSSGTEGIFASIEREQKIISLGGLNKYATVTSMTEVGGKYYATGGRALFSRSTDSGTTKWNETTVAGGADVASVGASGTDLYVVAGGKLYSNDGTGWSTVAGLNSSDKAYNLVPVRKSDGFSNDELIVVTRNGDGFPNLYRLDGTSITGPLALSKPAGIPSSWNLREVTSAVDNGTDYYVANLNYIWRIPSTTFDNSVVLDDTTGLPPSGYVGLMYYNSRLYVSTATSGSSGGGIYVTADPAAGTVAFDTIKDHAETALNAPVSFAQFLYNATNTSLWVATGPSTQTEGAGYAEVDLPGESYRLVPHTDTNNYTSSVLPNSAVGTLFLAADGTYFLGTYSQGLWTWDSGHRIWGQQ